MAVFKCKMCGGALEIQENQTVGVCEYCGTKQTLPKTNDEQVAKLFNRANNLRLKCEFDKAEQLYEKIVDENDEEAEAHWGIVLCKYGIEYVEDPQTHKRIPTCHRTLFESIIKDPDYLAAVDYSDSSQQVIYENEARAIDRIQKDILTIVKNEKPFDVFICYKETDEDGKRTIDSVIANDIYYQLTQEGFKVFYAAITLEDKIGQEYEPYIFAALTSSKVMLVIGTKPEYYTAVWVKNEWSRFMKLMKTDHSKMLIPCYKDMDAYELPEEFAHLQAQDMGKIGFINDVVRGIKKVIKKDEVKPKETNPTVDALITRAFLLLETGDWNLADEFCERVLNTDPENANAYFVKFLAEHHFHDKEELLNGDYSCGDNNNFIFAKRFADDSFRKELEEYERNLGNKKKETEYNQACKLISSEQQYNLDDLRKAVVIFDKLTGFKDSDEKRNDVENAIKNEEARLQREKELEEEKKAQIQKAKNQYEMYSKRLITCEDHTVALKYDKTVLACGENNLGACNVDKWFDIDMIAAFFDTTVAVDSDGYVKSAGLISGDKGFYSKSIKKIECSNHMICVLDEDQIHLISKGNSIYDVRGWGKLKDFTMGRDLIIGLKPDGKVLVTGDSEAVENVTKHWCDIEKISNYYYSYSDNYTFGFQRDGTVVSPDLDLSNVNDVIDIKISEYFAACLTSLGRISIIGQEIDSIKDAQGWNDIIGIAAGKSHLVGLKEDGTVVATGDNQFGQCDVSEWRNIIYITACADHTIGLKSDGTVVATGDNALGQCNVRNWKLFYLPEEIPERLQELSAENAKLNEELANLHGVFAKKRKNEIESLLDKNEIEMELLRRDHGSF